MLAALLLPPRTALAQDDLRMRVACRGQTISDIAIRREGPFVGDISKRWRWLGERLEALHTTTREDIVRRFLFFEIGEPCTELRRTESERVLRAQPFIADATVTAYDDGTGGVWLDVVTTDELSIILTASGRGASPRPTVLKVGDGNIGGGALSARVEWRDGAFYRDTYGGKITDYQFLGRPYQLTAAGARRRLGGDWNLEAKHPFFTDLQRVAWRVNAGGIHDYLTFVREAADLPSLSVRRDYVDVGGILRIGVPGRLSLFGASVSQEEEITDTMPVIISDSGLVSDTSAALLGRYQRYRTARINALWGVRNIRFRRVAAFDALTAPQDVRVGFQLGTLFGRGLSVLGAKDDDIFVSMDMYAGGGTGRSFLALQVQGEGRENYDAGHWDGVLGSGRLAWYAKPALRHTFELSSEWSAGWRQRVPFQLSLSDPEGGVRGYSSARYGGAQRIVVRAEERMTLGRVRNLAVLGLAGFVDGGRIWAGDAPFGVDTEIKYGAGVGLLAAVPPRSRRLWRVDVAVPLSPTTGKRWELRVSSGDNTRVFWREPRDVRRSRELSVPSSIFSWP